MKYIMFNLKFPLLALLAALTMCACVDRDFDEPPVNDGSVSFPEDQIISIGAVKAYYQQGQFVEIPDAKWMRGVVAGDDESGNIYKSLILQDDTDGITVLIDVVEFHNTFFTGREVFVNVEGLYISDFNGLVQIGAGPNDEGDMQRIPETLASERVQPGKYLGEVDPIVVSFTELNNSYQSRLIKFENVEFSSSELGRTYADVSNPTSPRSANRSIVNCNGSNFIVRNSGFADFAGDELPSGNGSITGIYGVFGSDQQLTIRDLNDVAMTGVRCDGSGGGGGANMAFDEDGNFIVDGSRVVSIADLKSEFYTAGQAVPITADRVIRGTVTSSDLEGNFFKEITFEDNSGGIKVRIDAFDLFETFPVGTDVALFAQGLFIGDFNGLVQIGGGADGSDILRIDEGIFRSHLFPGKNVGEPSPLVLKINELNNSHQNRLIQLEGVQFKSSSAGVTYSETNSTTNRELEDCDGNELILRNSSFADFASDITPEGNGTIKAIYGVFGSDQQLFIRDTRDVNFNNMRCDGGGGGGTGDRLSVQSVRDLYSGMDMDAPEGFIQGVVISDFENGNLTGRNLVLQDGDYGIVVRFSDNHSIPVNSEIQVNLNGAELSAFNGLLQVSDVANSNVTVLNNNSSIAPKEYTVAEILSNFDDVESTLVLIKGASLNGSGTFADGASVDDGTGSIDMFTRNDASFAGQALPNDPVDLTVIVSEFNNPQVLMRSADDLADNGGGGGGGEGFSEDFESGIDFDPWNASGWDNIALTGDRVWLKRSFDNNGFVEVRGFQEPMPNIEAWLISPSFDLADANILSFESATAFYTHGGLSVWISPEFSDFQNADWTPLNPNLYDAFSDDYDWIPSGDVMLNGSGRVRIGFKYEGDNSSNTETARIDNFQVR